MGLLEPALRRELADRSAAGRAVLFAYDEVTHSEPKPVRIRRVEPYRTRGQIRVRNTPGGCWSSSGGTA
jgi:hypothetical protein